MQSVMRNPDERDQIKYVQISLLKKLYNTSSARDGLNPQGIDESRMIDWGKTTSETAACEKLSDDRIIAILHDLIENSDGKMETVNESYIRYRSLHDGESYIEDYELTRSF